MQSEIRIDPLDGEAIDFTVSGQLRESLGLTPTLVEQALASVEQRVTAFAAYNDNTDSDLELDQYYTIPEIAAYCYDRLREHVDPQRYSLIEPSAGTGSFFRLLPPGSIAYDLDPKFPGVQLADFLQVRVAGDRPKCFIGNPPFGKNSSMARRFVNHAAGQGEIIAFILPRTFRKASTQNTIDRHFHLLHDEILPDRSFMFRGRMHSVPTLFQIWERRPHVRALLPTATTHPDFAFTTADLADFAIQRVGARAGLVHHDFDRSRRAHYFIRGNVEHVIRLLDFSSVTGNVAGNPSLAKSEIVELYRAHQSSRRSR